MSSLSVFPIEIIEWITSVLPSWMVCRLWLSGDRVLATKMANGGVTLLQLSWPAPSWNPWPRAFFGYFKALNAVSWGSEGPMAFCPSLDLTVLPPTLTSLNISTEDALCHVRSQGWKLDAMFPLLTSLELNGARITAEMFNNLPPTLTALVVAAHGEKLVHDQLFGCLPRGLDRLELWFETEDSDEEGNELPPNLKSLTISELETTFDWFKKVPRSVTLLSVSAKGPVNWASLPSGLQDLSVDYPSEIPSSVLSLLPQSLTNLSAWIEGGLKDSDIGLLPRSLTSFSDYTGNITHVGLQQAPPSLVSLSVNVAATHPEVISFYHPESTDIRLVNPPTGEPLIIKPLPLPLKLHSFTINNMSDAICKLLPPGLQVLDIIGGLITTEGSKIFPKLPLLRHLTIAINTFSNDVIPHIRHIRGLTFTAKSGLDVEQVQVTEDFLLHLLPSAASSSIAHAGPSPPKESSPFFSSDDDELKPISTLHLSFEEFEMGHLYLPKALFRRLSQFTNLEDLFILSHSHNIKSSWLSHLPSSLRRLEVGVLDTFPHPRHLAALPRKLTSLCLEVRTGPRHETYSTAGSCSWVDQDLASLPPDLTSLRINTKMVNLTHELNSYTPPYLNEFRLSWSDFKLFRDPLTRAFGPDTNISRSDDELSEEDDDSGSA